MFSSEVEKLQSGHPRERWNAADALGRLGRTCDVSSAVPALLRLAEDEDDDVRCAAARALGHVGSDARCASELVRLLADDDGCVRFGAAEGLGNLGSSASCGTVQLKEALEDEEEDVRAASAQALGKLVKSGSVAAADVVPSVMRCFADEEWSVRRSAAEALGRCGDPGADAMAMLRKAARTDQNPVVRRAADLALSSILGPSQA